MAHDFTGSVAVVVGASKGIGAGTGLAFAQAGAAVVPAARDDAAVRGLADQITADGGKATALWTDATDPGSMAQAVDVAVTSYGGLHLAFNNATDGPMPAPLADIDLDEFDRGIATNMRGTFVGMKYQVPAMLATDNDPPKAVVNMASSAALHPVSNLAAYVAGKAATIGLTKVAALDYADRGVRTNIVAPGPVLHPPPPGGRPGGATPGGPRDADAAHRRSRGGRPHRPVAVLAGSVVHQRRRGAHRWGPKRGQHAGTDVPTRRRDVLMNTTAEILELGDRWARAESAGDVDTLAGLADDGFRLVGPFGFVLDKEQWLDRYRSGAFHTSRLEWDEVSVADHGDVAIAIGKQTQQAAYHGRPSNGEFRISHVLARKPDGWRLIGMHLSQAAPPPRP